MSYTLKQLFLQKRHMAYSYYVRNRLNLTWYIVQGLKFTDANYEWKNTMCSI